MAIAADKPLTGTVQRKDILSHGVVPVQEHFVAGGDISGLHNLLGVPLIELTRAFREVKMVKCLGRDAIIMVNSQKFAGIPGRGDEGLGRGRIWG